MKENKELRMRELPKRPKSVFAMFCEENKKNVEPGKGEGKGRDALQKLWATVEEEKKAEYAKREAELKEKWQKDVETFKASATYKTYEETNLKIRKEFEVEAVKVTTLAFLREAPMAPPKSALAFFVTEKREAKAKEADSDEE